MIVDNNNHEYKNITPPQGLTGSLDASTPFLGGFLGAIILAWLHAARNLGARIAGNKNTARQTSNTNTCIDVTRK